MELKRLDIVVASLAILTSLGCGSVGQGDPRPGLDEAVQDPFEAAFSVAPSDPDTIVSVTEVGRDARGDRTITRRTMTKRELWLAVTSQPQERTTTGNVEAVRSAATFVDRVCGHFTSKDVLFNDDVDFKGSNWICFLDDGRQDGDNDEPVNDLIGTFGFTARSYWTWVPTCLWNDDRTFRDGYDLYGKFFNPPRFHQVNNISGGSPTRFLQTPGNDMDNVCSSSPPN